MKLTLPISEHVADAIIQKMMEDREKSYSGEPPLPDSEARFTVLVSCKGIVVQSVHPHPRRGAAAYSVDLELRDDGTGIEVTIIDPVPS